VSTLGIINVVRYRYHLRRFTKRWPNHWSREDDFGGFWRRKVETETRSEHILDETHTRETYDSLCRILPKWNTYWGAPPRVDWRGALAESLRRLFEAYDRIRGYSLLEFSEVPRQSLELIWHELGRVKESHGKRNPGGSYFVIAISKPLMLLWGQTPAFDSRVRDNFLEDFPMYPKHRFGNRWRFEDWNRAMKKLQEDLKRNPEVISYFKEESQRIFGTDSIVPYGRFLDIHYYF